MEAFYQETAKSLETTIHMRSFTWSHCTITLPGSSVVSGWHILHLHIPPATECGWKEVGDRLVPVPTRDFLAPAFITHLIKCACKKTSCASHCSCRSQRLNCFEMCMCGAAEEVCSNVSQGLMMTTMMMMTLTSNCETLIVTFLVSNQEKWWLEDVKQRILK